MFTKCYEYLKTIYILNDKAICAVLGNAYAESALQPDNVENISGMDDAIYTQEVDAGKRNFNDGFGYGLFQWTYYTRKNALLDFARSRKTSISDYQMQLDFMMHELETDFTKVFDVLQNEGNSLDFMTEYFMKIFENPADKSVNATLKRVNIAKEFFSRIPGGTSAALTGEISVNGKRYKIVGDLIE